MSSARIEADQPRERRLESLLAPLLSLRLGEVDLSERCDCAAAGEIRLLDHRQEAPAGAVRILRHPSASSRWIIDCPFQELWIALQNQPRPEIDECIVRATASRRIPERPHVP